MGSFSLLLAAFSVCTQFVVFLLWIHRRVRDDEINRAFIRDVANAHLPNIYSALNIIAIQQGIALDPPPLINFVDLNPRNRRH
jgi:hypothetical protein